MRLLPGIQNGFNRKGLISDQGQKKKAFFTLQSYYAGKGGALARRRWRVFAKREAHPICNSNRTFFYLTVSVSGMLCEVTLVPLLP